MNASPTPSATRSGLCARWAIPALVILVLIVFGRLCVAEFSEWDDPGTIATNPDFTRPIADALRIAWTQQSKGLYVPVTLTVWTLLASVSHTSQPDALGYWINPWFFHGFNVLCHAVSTVLAFLILRRLCRTPAAALLGAAFFAVHPLQVETVAWASGTKDLLCWLFCLAATLLYVARAQREPADDRTLWRGSSLPIAFGLMLLALLSKPTAMVLPAALFVIDIALLRPQRWRRALTDLVPFALLALAGAYVARTAQYIEHIEPAPLWARPFIVGDALWHYIVKLLWPTNLALDYGRKPQVVLAQPMIYVRWILPAAIGMATFLLRRRWPRVWTGLCIAVIGLAPVLGFATFQMQGYSTVTDHYVYFSMFGIALAVTVAIDQFIERRRRLAWGISASILALLAVRSFVQAGLWRDSPTLFAHAIEVNPDSAAMRTNLAEYYLHLDPPRPDLAEPLMQRALALAPHDLFTIVNDLQCKSMLGKFDDVDAELNELSKLLESPRADRRDRARWLGNVAVMLLQADRIDEARQWARRALDALPESTDAQQVMAAIERADAARAATRPAR